MQLQSSRSIVQNSCFFIMGVGPKVISPSRNQDSSSGVGHEAQAPNCNQRGALIDGVGARNAKSWMWIESNNNTKYHHFRNKVQDGTISIHPASTEDMLADILTKICNEETHTKCASN
jgi:hypothetical protein